MKILLLLVGLFWGAASADQNDDDYILQYYSPPQPQPQKPTEYYAVVGSPQYLQHHYQQPYLPQPSYHNAPYIHTEFYDVKPQPTYRTGKVYNNDYEYGSNDPKIYKKGPKKHNKAGHKKHGPRHNEHHPKDNEYAPRHNEYAPKHNEYAPKHNEYAPRHNEYAPRHNEYHPIHDDHAPWHSVNAPNAPNVPNVSDLGNIQPVFSQTGGAPIQSENFPPGMIMPGAAQPGAVQPLSFEDGPGSSTFAGPGGAFFQGTCWNCGFVGFNQGAGEREEGERRRQEGMDRQREQQLQEGERFQNQQNQDQAQGGQGQAQGGQGQAQGGQGQDQFALGLPNRQVSFNDGFGSASFAGPGGAFFQGTCWNCGFIGFNQGVGSNKMRFEGHGITVDNVDLLDSNNDNMREMRASGPLYLPTRYYIPQYFFPEIHTTYY